MGAEEESGTKTGVGAVRGNLAVLAPAVAASAALLAHQILPSRQSALSTRIYPILLESLLGAALLLAFLQWT
jgi:hypothetical protein